MANHRATRWRGKLKPAAHTHPVVRQFFDLLNDEHACMCEVAARAGVRRGTVGDWRNRRMPRVDLIDAALNALGYRLAVVKQDSKGRVRVIPPFTPFPQAQLPKRCSK